MRVACFPSDAFGCGYYRMRWAAIELARQGHDVEIRESVTAIWERGDPDRVVGVKDCDFDVAVFQRVYRQSILDLIVLLQTQGVAVVVDIDDDLLALDPGHVMYGEFEGRKVHGIMQESVRKADLVTVSTPALAKRYGGSKARVIPNGVPRAYLGIGYDGWRQLPPVIGWTGTPKTHVGDLDVLGSTIRDLCGERRARFRAIGDGASLALLDIPDQEHSPGAPLATLEYAHLYAQLDVAIVPLRETRFNAGKSWLKAAEAAALGVPVVMSPTPENVRLHGLGIGVLAERPREWREQLLRLLSAQGLREAIAAQGRAIMADWTIEERIAPMCWEAWTGARNLRSRCSLVKAATSA